MGQGLARAGPHPCWGRVFLVTRLPRHAASSPHPPPFTRQDIVAACGDGRLDPGEQCDPPGPACLPNCTRVPTPPAGRPEPSVSSAPPIALASVKASAAATPTVTPPHRIPSTPPADWGTGYWGPRNTTSESLAATSPGSDGVDPTVRGFRFGARRECVDSAHRGRCLGGVRLLTCNGGVECTLCWTVKSYGPAQDPGVSLCGSFCCS